MKLIDVMILKERNMDGEKEGAVKVYLEVIKSYVVFWLKFVKITPHFDFQL